jgi:hypothetical protein
MIVVKPDDVEDLVNEYAVNASALVCGQAKLPRLALA